MRTHRADIPGSRGFTLLEVVTVVVLVGILAAAVLPAMGGLGGARTAAAAVETRRLVTVAREFALLTGEPAAIEVDPDDDSLRLLWIDPDTGEIEPLPDALGTPRGAVALPEVFRGAAIDAFEDGAGVPGPGRAWFGFDGAPELRDGSGALLGLATEDAQVTLADGAAIVIRRGSGLIE